MNKALNLIQFVVEAPAHYNRWEKVLCGNSLVADCLRTSVCWINKMEMLAMPYISGRCTQANRSAFRSTSHQKLIHKLEIISAKIFCGYSESLPFINIWSVYCGFHSHRTMHTMRRTYCVTKLVCCHYRMIDSPMAYWILGTLKR